MGWYIGFTGAVTFRGAKKAAAVAQDVPAARILIETDCPYMAPEPVRGTRCDSAMLVHTGAKIAVLRGIEPEVFYAQSCENACRFYGIPL